MVVVIGALTAATSHATVIAYLNEIDDRQTDIA
jgi:cell division transport system permease protein